VADFVVPVASLFEPAVLLDHNEMDLAQHISRSFVKGTREYHFAPRVALRYRDIPTRLTIVEMTFTNMLHECLLVATTGQVKRIARARVTQAQAFNRLACT